MSRWQVANSFSVAVFLFYFFMTDANIPSCHVAKKKFLCAPFYVATRNPATGEWAFPSPFSLLSNKKIALQFSYQATPYSHAIRGCDDDFYDIHTSICIG